LERFYSRFVVGQDNFGAVYSHNGQGYVLFDESYRVGLTQFFTTDGLDLFYFGEDPDDVSGGVALSAPWDSAKRLKGPIHYTGRSNETIARAASKFFGMVQGYDAGEENYEDEDHE
jgi:hypothetical protein